MQINNKKPFVLIGGGGHAKVILDMLALHNVVPTMYVDDADKPWLNAMGMKRMTDETLPADAQCTISFGAITNDMLSVRRKRQKSLQAKGLSFPAIIHPRAIVSSSATIGDGVHINAGAKIGAGSIINSGAIIEHDVSIGEGCHVAPSATVLGDAVLGDEVFVGSGAVIIQGARVGNSNFVRAMTCYTHST